MLRTAFRISIAFAIALLVAVGGPSGSAQAATIVVNSTADAIADDGQCTLREAIIAANNDAASGVSGGECAAGSGDDTIALPFGFYQLSIPGINEGSSATGDLDVRTNMTISGAGQGTTVDGGGLDRVFEVGPAGTSGVVATISGLMIRNGVTTGGLGGGLINNSLSTLTLKDSIVTQNSGTGMRNPGTTTFENVVFSENSDRGLITEGTAIITDSTFTNNTETTGSGGAGIYIFGPTPTLTMSNSTVSGNTTSGNGGGFRLSWGGPSTGTIAIMNSTISGNSADIHGGGIELNASGYTLTMNNVTISGNTTDADTNDVGDGGGVHVSAGLLSLQNTIVAGNFDETGQAPDCGGVSLDSRGYNLVQSTGGCTLTGNLTGNITGLDPQLGPLEANSGHTMAHDLLPSSPAIDAGSPSQPGSGGNACELRDQSGVPRPQIAACDIGAMEHIDPSLVPSLSQWALIGLAVALAALAFRRIGYRRTLWQQ